MFGVNYFCRFRRLFLPVHLLFLTTLLGHSGAVAGDVEFQDDRVVDHPVDGRGCGHWVGEDVLPLGEDQVGRDAQGPAFVALGDEAVGSPDLVYTTRICPSSGLFCHSSCDVSLCK